MSTAQAESCSLVCSTWWEHDAPMSAIVSLASRNRIEVQTSPLQCHIDCQRRRAANGSAQHMSPSVDCSFVLGRVKQYSCCLDAFAGAVDERCGGVSLVGQSCIYP